jgi:hypothetical protein
MIMILMLDTSFPWEKNMLIGVKLLAVLGMFLAYNILFGVQKGFTGRG